MRLVLHAIENFVGRRELVDSVRPPVEIYFQVPPTHQAIYELGPDRIESELPARYPGELLRADIKFRGMPFSAGWKGAGLSDSLHFRLHNAFRLDTWLVHNTPAPPNCRAICEDSGVEGYPCVECVKGDLRVRICC